MTYGTTYTDTSQGASLTYDRLLETYARIPKAPPELRVIEVPLYAVKVQARRHPRKKRRLQKKWLARYGTRTEYRRHFAPGQMLVDKQSGVVESARFAKLLSEQSGLCLRRVKAVAESLSLYINFGQGSRVSYSRLLWQGSLGCVNTLASRFYFST